jgi:hypothetical protein
VIWLHVPVLSPETDTIKAFCVCCKTIESIQHEIRGNLFCGRSILWSYGRCRALSRLMLVRFRATYNQSATKEFLVVQFLDRTFRLFDGLHLHKGKTLRALIVAIAYDLGVLHVPDAVEQFEKIALRSVEGKVANVKTRRSNFNSFGPARRSRWLRAIARLCRRFAFLAAVSEKFGNTLPKRFFLRLRRFLWSPNAFVISSASAPTARAAWASSG